MVEKRDRSRSVGNKRSKLESGRTPSKSQGREQEGIQLLSTSTWLTGKSEPKVMRQERDKWPSVVELSLALAVLSGTGTTLLFFTVFAVLDAFVFYSVPSLCYIILLKLWGLIKFNAYLEKSFKFLILESTGLNTLISVLDSSQQLIKCTATVALLYYSKELLRVKRSGSKWEKIIQSLILSGCSYASMQYRFQFDINHRFEVMCTISGILVALGYFLQPYLIKKYIPKADLDPACSSC